MTDRELLELAARAAGLRVKFEEVHGCYWIELGQGIPIDVWNPLDHDGDALRLAVKMRMMVDVDEYRVQALAEIAMHEGLEPETVYFDGQSIGVNRGDVNSATRRAIVRAAAKIGRSM